MKDQLFVDMFSIMIEKYMSEVTKVSIEEMFDLDEQENILTVVYVLNKEIEVDRKYDIIQFHYTLDTNYIEIVKLIETKYDDCTLYSTVKIDVETFLECLNK